jgi:hypothetical protein
MKHIYFLFLLFAPFFVFSQSNQPKADALVTPRFAEQTITVGGSGADIQDLGTVPSRWPLTP